MEYLEKNIVVFDNSSKIKYNYDLGKIKNTTLELHKVFGFPKKKNNIHYWKFEANNSKFKIYDKTESNEWYLSSNTNDKLKIKYFLAFLSEVRKTVRSSRSLHKSIPIYDKSSYQLKGKIAIYAVPPIEPPRDIKIFKERKEIPKKNKYGELVFEDHPDFKPNLTPKEVIHLGSFGGTYFRPILSGITGKVYQSVWKEFPDEWFEGIDIQKYVTSVVIQKEVNKYKVKVGGNLDMWESSGWITETDPYGWFQWYCRFYLCRRSTDDERQIKRWLKSSGSTGRFRVRLIKSIIKEKAKFDDFSVGASGRQGLLHWGYELTKKDFNDYKKKYEEK